MKSNIQQKSINGFCAEFLPLVLIVRKLFSQIFYKNLLKASLLKKLNLTEDLNLTQGILNL